MTLVPASSKTAGGTAGGDLSGTYPNPTVADINGSPLGTTTGASTNQALSWNGSAWVPATISVGGGLGVYGDASDGAQVFDGTTTILGIAPSPNSAVNGVYTLTRDIFLASSTLNSGISIVPNGFRIFCQGTFTNNGLITYNGGNGGNGTTVGGTAGAALSNGNSPINNGANYGAAGGAGATGAGSGGASNATRSYGGAGGHGGAGSSAGGAAGTVGAPTATNGSIRAAPFAVLGTLFNSGTPAIIAAGAGGGGGGGDGTNAGGGGGGGGGFVFAYVKTFAGTGVIQARGGTGGNGNGTGNTGGGGGGGGGLVLVISASVSAGAISGQTIDANGGNHGTSNGTGGGLIANGANGTVILIPN